MLFSKVKSRSNARAVLPPLLLIEYETVLFSLVFLADLFICRNSLNYHFYTGMFLALSLLFYNDNKGISTTKAMVSLFSGFLHSVQLLKLMLLSKFIDSCSFALILICVAGCTHSSSNPKNKLVDIAILCISCYFADGLNHSWRHVFLYFVMSIIPYQWMKLSQYEVIIINTVLVLLLNVLSLSCSRTFWADQPEDKHGDLVMLYVVAIGFVCTIFHGCVVFHVTGFPLKSSGNNAPITHSSEVYFTPRKAPPKAEKIVKQEPVHLSSSCNAYRSPPPPPASPCVDDIDMTGILYDSSSHDEIDIVDNIPSSILTTEAVNQLLLSHSPPPHHKSNYVKGRVRSTSGASTLSSLSSVSWGSYSSNCTTESDFGTSGSSVSMSPDRNHHRHYCPLGSEVDTNAHHHGAFSSSLVTISVCLGAMLYVCIMFGWMQIVVQLSVTSTDNSDLLPLPQHLVFTRAFVPVQYLYYLEYHPVLWILSLLLEEHYNIPYLYLWICIVWACALIVTVLLTASTEIGSASPPPSPMKPTETIIPFSSDPATVIDASSAASINTRDAIMTHTPQIIVRKQFHVLAVLLFLPVIYLDDCVQFMSLAFGVALCGLIVLEFVRVSCCFGKLSTAITAYYAPFIDGRDTHRPLVLTHIYLLCGIAIPVWMEALCSLQAGHKGWSCVGVSLRHWGWLAVGVGDSMAAFVGVYCPAWINYWLPNANYEVTRWGGGCGNRSVEGSLAGAVSMGIAASFLVVLTKTSYLKHLVHVWFLSVLVALAETVAHDIDNLVLPIVCTCVIMMCI